MIFYLAKASSKLYAYIKANKIKHIKAEYFRYTGGLVLTDCPTVYNKDAAYVAVVILKCSAEDALCASLYTKHQFINFPAHAIEELCNNDFIDLRIQVSYESIVAHLSNCATL